MSRSIEPLESRQLFAAPAGGSVHLTKTGTLFVNGTSGRDIITVEREGAVAVRFGGASKVDFDAEGSVHSGVYAAALVKRIRVDAGGGNDVINYSRTDGKAANVTLYGGKGRDAITAAGRTVTLLGGSGEDTLISRQYARYRYADDAVRRPYEKFVTTNDDGSLVGSAADDKTDGDLPLPRDSKGNVISMEDSFSYRFLESRNVLDGGDASDVFESLGGDDTVIGGDGPDRLTTSNSLLVLFEDGRSLESKRLQQVDSGLYRSRLAATSVDYVDQPTSGGRWYVELETTGTGFT